MEGSGWARRSPAAAPSAVQQKQRARSARKRASSAAPLSPAATGTQRASRHTPGPNLKIQEHALRCSVPAIKAILGFNRDHGALMPCPRCVSRSKDSLLLSAPPPLNPLLTGMAPRTRQHDGKQHRCCPATGHGGGTPSSCSGVQLPGCSRSSDGESRQSIEHGRGLVQPNEDGDKQCGPRLKSATGKKPTEDGERGVETPNRHFVPSARGAQRGALCLGGARDKAGSSSTLRCASSSSTQTANTATFVFRRSTHTGILHPLVHPALSCALYGAKQRAQRCAARSPQRRSRAARPPPPLAVALGPRYTAGGR